MKRLLGVRARCIWATRMARAASVRVRAAEHAIRPVLAVMADRGPIRFLRHRVDADTPTVDPSLLEEPEDRETLIASLPESVREEAKSMDYDELLTLAEGYRLFEAKEADELVPEPVEDLSYVYAPSNDPAELLSLDVCGKLYTIPEDEYKRLFPPIANGGTRVPLDSPIHRALDKRFIMVRTPAQFIIGNLRAFARNRFPQAAEAAALREEWEKSGQKIEAIDPFAAKQPVPAAPEEGEEDEEEEEAVEEEAEVKAEAGEEDDEYDYFGAAEDAEEEAAKIRAAEEAAERAGIKKLSDVELYGTVKELAVDENFVHVDQTYELELTPPPPKDQTKPKSIFMLRGKRGVGKSASLYHVVHYARKHGWIVFFIPSGYEYMHEGMLIRPSPHFKGFFDTPDLAHNTLKQLAHAHGHQFAQLRIKDPAVLSRARLAKGGTLADLIRVGITKFRDATTCLVDLKAEIERQTDYPVLFAVDDFSEWHYNTPYFFAQKRIEAERLAVIRMLRDLVPAQYDVAGGHHNHIAVVVATSERYPRIKDKKKLKKMLKVKPLPRKTCYDVPVSLYSKAEFDNIFKFFGNEKLWGDKPDLRDAQVAHARVLTCGNSEVLFKDALVAPGAIFAPEHRVGKFSKFGLPFKTLAEVYPPGYDDKEADQAGQEIQQAASA